MLIMNTGFLLQFTVALHDLDIYKNRDLTKILGLYQDINLLIMLSFFGRNLIVRMVTTGRKRLQGIGLSLKGISPLPGLQKSGTARIHFYFFAQAIHNIL